MTTLMRNGRDRRSGRTRFVPREERARAFGWDPISGSHQGQRPQRPHSKAVYMAAPERFAEMSDSSLAPRAPSIHGTERRIYGVHPSEWTGEVIANRAIPSGLSRRKPHAQTPHAFDRVQAAGRSGLPRRRDSL